jgi:hypothetical protein
MADRKDLKEPEDLAEFRMRSFRIRLNSLGAGFPQVGVMRQTGWANPSPCERLAAEASFARLLIVDKFNARLHFRAPAHAGGAHHVADAFGLHRDASVRHPTAQSASD